MSRIIVIIIIIIIIIVMWFRAARDEVLKRAGAASDYPDDERTQAKAWTRREGGRSRTGPGS